MNDPDSRKPLASRLALPSLAATRRSFLKYLGGAAAAGVVPEVLAGCSVEHAAPSVGHAGLADTADTIGGTGIVPGASFRVTRPRDGVVLTFTPLNLAVDTTGKNLVRQNAALPTYLVAELDSQHLDEPAEDFGTGVEHHAAGPSRLVFRMPDGTTSVPMKLDAILGLCSSAPLSIANNAISAELAASDPERWAAALGGKTASDAGSSTPDTTVTSLEVPYRLILSPNERGRFVHAPKPIVGASGRVELWNTRLAVADATGVVNERLSPTRYLRAIRTRDADLTTGSAFKDGQETLGPAIRAMIVAQTSDFSATVSGDQVQGRPTGGKAPPSITAETLVLTPLGATFDLHAEWNKGDLAAPPTLTSWKQRAQLGRDAYEQASVSGFVLPFGLRAIAVETVWRAMDEQETRLRSQWQIHLIDTSADFGTGDGLPPVEFRGMPFQRVRVKGKTCFDVDPIKLSVPKSIGGKEVNVANTVVYATRDEAAVMLPIEALDRKGRKVTFSVPLVWTMNDATTLTSVKTTYQADVDFPRQRVAFAPSSGDTTSLEIAWMRFKFDVATVAYGDLAIRPYVAALLGTPEVIRHLTTADTSSAPAGPTVHDAYFAYHDAYAPVPTATRSITASLGRTSLPLDAKPAEQMVLRCLIRPDHPEDPSNVGKLELRFPSNGGPNGGGIVQPNAKLNGISMGLGVVNDAKGQFDPTEYFGDVFGAGKLLGLVPLSALFDGDALGPLADAAPTFMTESLHVAERYLTELAQAADVLPALREKLEAKIQSELDADGAIVSHAADHVRTLLANLTDPAIVTDQLNNISNDLQALSGALDRLIAALSDDTLGCSGLRRAAINQLTKAKTAINAGVTAIPTGLSMAQAAFNNIKAAITAVQQGLDLARDLKTKIEWRPSIPLKDGGYRDVVGGLLTFNKPDPLCLSVQIDGKAHDPASGTTIFASLDDFFVNFPPGHENACVQLQFDRIFFSKAPNTKAEIDVNLKDIVFANQLSFIQGIRKAIPLDGFSDPPHIDVDAEGIHASFSVGLPNFPFGIFSIENLKVSAGLEVPFFGDAITFRFSFADRDDPFTVTVAFLGGGGYFMLELAADASHGGVAFRRLEASLDVCAQISLDIGVAKGSVSITAGFRFAYDASTGASLTGFVDLRGSLDILGLVTISVEARMEVTYDFTDNSIAGSCTLTVEVDVAFFSKSVELHFEKRFGGDGGQRVTAPQSASSAAASARTFGAMTDPAPPPALPPPTFAGLVSADVWTHDYLVAFG